MVSWSKVEVGKDGMRMLLAVDEGNDSEMCVKYAAKVTSWIQDMAYTLFAVESWVPGMLIRARQTDPEARLQVDQLITENREKARLVVRRLRSMMIREGVLESRIETIARPIQQGIAKDILTCATSFSCRAIVISRRGLTPARDFFIGTIASKIVEHALDIPVWVVGDEIASMDVLVAVDGSDSSLDMVRYVFNTIGGHPDARVTLFHVTPRLRHFFPIQFEAKYPSLQPVLEKEDQRCMHGFDKGVRKLLKTTKHLQVETRVKLNSYDISTAILDEARTGRYGTVVVGRRGERGAFFAGRVPLRLVQKISGPTLWIVP